MTRFIVIGHTRQDERGHNNRWSSDRPLAGRDPRTEVHSRNPACAAATTQFRSLRRAELRVDHERAFGDVAVRIFEEVDLPLAGRALHRERCPADQPLGITLHRRSAVQSVDFVGEATDRLLAQQWKDAFQTRVLRRMQIDHVPAGCDHRVHQRLLITPHVLEHGDDEIAGEAARCVSHSKIALTARPDDVPYVGTA